MNKESVIRDITVTQPIHCIYFYYVKYNKEERPVVKLYYQADEDTRIRDEVDLRRIIKVLARNAIEGDFAPPPCGDSFGKVPWRRRSYFVLLVEGLDCELSDPSDVSIAFQECEEVNHSFFNARLMDIDLSDDNSGAMVTVFHCVNLMRHKTGRDMRGGEREKYLVDILPDSDRRVRFEDDDGGTNQGGPIPPIIDFAARESRLA